MAYAMSRYFLKASRTTSDAEHSRSAAATLSALRSSGSRKTTVRILPPLVTVLVPPCGPVTGSLRFFAMT